MYKIKSFEVFADEQQAVVTYENGHEEIVNSNESILFCVNCYFWYTTFKADGQLSNRCYLILPWRERACHRDDRNDRKHIIWLKVD